MHRARDRAPDRVAHAELVEDPRHARDDRQRSARVHAKTSSSFLLGGMTRNASARMRSISGSVSVGDSDDSVSHAERTEDALDVRGHVTGRVERQLGCRRRLVGQADAGQIGELAAARGRVEALGIA